MAKPRKGKLKVTPNPKNLPTIVINSEENDDWMKTLPGYKTEIAIHEKLAKLNESKE